MPIVEINGQELEFPDTMSPDEIKGVLRQKFPPPQAPQQGNAGSAARAVAYGIAGGQVPFGNVITSGIGAGIAKAASPFTGDERTYRELYDQAQADTKATQEANPLATLGGNALGIVSTLPIGFTKSLSGQVPTQDARGALNAIPAGLSKVGDFVRGGAVAKPGAGQALLRGAKAGLVSAAVAGLYGAGEADAGNRIQQGIESAGMGAAIGAALPVGGAVLGAAGKAALPKIDEGLKDTAKLARKYGIPLSFDQISNSRALKTAQKVSQEVPFSGQEKFRDAQLSAWNKALQKTVGIDADKFTKVNAGKAFLNVGREFDNLGKGKVFQFSDDFVRGLDEIRADAQATMTKDALDNFETVVRRVLSEADGAGNITGEKLGKLRSEVNRLTRKSNNPDTQELLRDLENKIIDTMTAGDDLASGAFSETKRKYKNLIVLEPLIAKAKGGNISPALLNDRVSKVYGRSQTTGNAGEIGELAQIGFELLPELTGSDTAGKAALIGLGSTAVGGFIDPVLGATAVGTMAANRAAQSGLNRNQRLIDKAISSGMRDELLKIIQNGGKITEKQIMELPPKEAKSILQLVKKEPSLLEKTVKSNKK